MIEFRLEHGELGPRAGTLLTPHGEIDTPVFMPVGTQATVKTLTPAEIRDLGAGIILANSYHLYLRPGAAAIAAAGGLHRFMAWPSSLLTDSGGFQVFSLGGLRRLDDDGASFRSHIDGSEHRLTPESVTRTQELIGADIIMAFDECPPADAARTAAVIATQRTHRWAERCQAAQGTDAALFGICQGGMFADLRAESAGTIAAMGFSGNAIGGLSVGEAKSATWPLLAASVGALPVERPRYLMGVGSPEDLVEGVRRGVDMFDCVLPARLARNGSLFSATGRVNITNARFAGDQAAIEEDCDCLTCQTFTAGYLHHLFRCGELLGHRLATIHNLRFLVRHMERLRQSIVTGTFEEFAAEFLSLYRPADELARLAQRERGRPAGTLRTFAQHRAGRGSEQLQSQRPRTDRRRDQGPG